MGLREPQNPKPTWMGLVWVRLSPLAPLIIGLTPHDTICGAMSYKSPKMAVFGTKILRMWVLDHFLNSFRQLFSMKILFLENGHDKLSNAPKIVPIGPKLADLK